MSNDEQYKVIGLLVIQHQEQQRHVVCVEEKRKKLVSALRKTQELLEGSDSIMMTRADNDSLTIDQPSGGLVVISPDPPTTHIEYPSFAELQKFIADYKEAINAFNEVESQLKKIHPGLFSNSV